MSAVNLTTGLTARIAMETEPQAYTPPKETGLDKAVPWGFYHIDQAFPRGIKPLMSQLIAIQGEGGARKTTLLLNIILNQFLSGMLPAQYRMAVDSLETGMTIERYFMVMRCMLATKIMVYEFYTGPQGAHCLYEMFNRPLPNDPPELLLEGITSPKHGKMMKDCVLFPDYVEACYAAQPGFNFSERQVDAWEKAGAAIATFPIIVYGVSEHYDEIEREKRFTDTSIIENAFERWLALAEKGIRQLVIDHITAYFLDGSDYEKQMRVIPYLERWVKLTGSTLWAISQESVTNIRAARSGGKVVGSMGGNKLHFASQTDLRVDYDRDLRPFWTRFEILKGRRGHFPPIGIMTCPISGAMFGRTMEWEEIVRTRL